MSLPMRDIKALVKITPSGEADMAPAPPAVEVKQHDPTKPSEPMWKKMKREHEAKRKAELKTKAPETGGLRPRKRLKLKASSRQTALENAKEKPQEAERKTEGPEDNEAKTADGSDITSLGGSHLIDAANSGQQWSQASKKWVPITIVQGKKDDVWKGSIGRVMTSGYYRIPIFQRRYAWQQPQWNLLLNDTLKALRTGQEHSLRRINVLKIGNDEKRPKTLVIDGQQRLTTLSLLLASIRDVALSTKTKEGDALAERIDAILFPDPDALQAWAKENAGKPVEEGLDLACCIVSPTYFDRQAFAVAILPEKFRPKTKITGPDQTLQAKRFFVRLLQGEGVGRVLRLKTFATPSEAPRKEDPERFVRGLELLLDALLTKLNTLYFGVDLSEGRPTEQLQIVFERLAAHNNTWEKPRRASEGVKMSPVSFIRNLVLSCFPKEEDAIKVYKEKWLGLEVAAGKRDELVEEFFTAFLNSASPQSKKQSTFGNLGGGLYARFRAWFGTQIGKSQADAQKDALKVVDKLVAWSDLWIPPVKKQKSGSF